MKRFVFPFLATALLLGSYATASAQDTKTCEQWRCDFQSQLSACDCDTATNHGRYVSCVAHVVRDLVKEGLPRNCKGKIKRCAARSTCGKQSRGFETCTSTITGTCDLDTSTCANNPRLACLLDSDCDSTRCRVTRRGCREGEVANISASCCPTCGPQ